MTLLRQVVLSFSNNGKFIFSLPTNPLLIYFSAILMQLEPLQATAAVLDMTDLFRLILTFLSIPDLLSLLTVSHEWNLFIATEPLIFRAAQQMYGSFMTHSWPRANAFREMRGPKLARILLKDLYDFTWEQTHVHAGDSLSLVLVAPHTPRVPPPPSPLSLSSFSLLSRFCASPFLHLSPFAKSPRFLLTHDDAPRVA